MDIFLTTAFAFMACDGEIVKEEIDLIKNMAHNGLIAVENIDEQLNTLTATLNNEGKSLLRNYLNKVGEANLTKDDAIKLLRIAINTIFADNVVAYSEVKFFRAVRSRLTNIDDTTILNTFEEIEDFWLENDIKSDIFSIEKDYFDNIEIPKFDLSKIMDTADSK